MADTTVTTFLGSGNEYTEIATRGSEILGIDVKYGVRPDGVGALVVRFAAHGKGQPFTHFAARGESQYRRPDPNAQHFFGTRLNKTVVPLFQPGPHPMYLGQVMDQYALWPIVSDWIIEQVKAEGFELLFADVVALLKERLNVAAPPTAGTQLVVDFPDLAAYKAALPIYLLSPSFEEEKAADEAEDEDSDEDDDDADTVN